MIKLAVETKSPTNPKLPTKRPCPRKIHFLNYVAAGRQESPKNRTHSPVAQLVERRTVNPFVVGSSPTGGAHYGQRSFPMRWPFFYRVFAIFERLRWASARTPDYTRITPAGETFRVDS